MTESVKPFLRWAGGKRWLAALLHEWIAPRIAKGGSYYEPFLGSGAMFFRFAPKRAVLSDLNGHLINAFNIVARSPSELARRLAVLPSDRTTYFAIRDANPTDPIDRAVRFVYLNRNCWGGLYRENRHRDFNTPWGGGKRYHFALVTDRTLERAASLLAQDGIEMNTCDFEQSLSGAGSGDIIYCDPTYRPRTRRQFDRYGKTIFDWKDQERLAAGAWQAFERGATVLVSNASCLDVRKLYKGAQVLNVHRRKVLAPNKNDALDEKCLFILDPGSKCEDWSRIGTAIHRQPAELEKFPNRIRVERHSKPCDRDQRKIPAKQERVSA